MPSRAQADQARANGELRAAIGPGALGLRGEPTYSLEVAPTQAGYLAGRFSVLELADAYGAWRDARLRAVELAAAARQSEIDLSRAVGVRLGAP